MRKNTEKEFPEGIPAYGADALRFTFASLATLGRNINFDTKRCEGYRNFCNKLWNATRFVLMNCEGQDCGLKEHTKAECAPAAVHGYLRFSQADRWIIGELQRVEADGGARASPTTAWTTSANAIYEFVWDEYCDWYLEIAKVQIADRRRSAAARHAPHADPRAGSHAAPAAPGHALHHRGALAEGRAGGRRKARATSVSVAAPYPQAQPERDRRRRPSLDGASSRRVVDACRNLRSEMNLSPAAARAAATCIGDAAFMREAAPVLQALAKLSEVKVFDDEAAFAAATRSRAGGGGRRRAPGAACEIDVAAEKARLGKEIARLKARSPRPTASCQRRLRGARAGRGGRAGDAAPRRLHGRRWRPAARSKRLASARRRP